MPFTLGAAVGAATANSYRTLDAFGAFLAGAGVAADAHAADAQARALAAATRALDALVYPGAPASDTQSLQWPRVDAPDPDRPGATFGPGVLPRRLTAATDELALAVLGGADLRGGDRFAGLRASGVARAKVGSLDVEFRADASGGGAGGTGAADVQRYPAAWALIAPLLTARAAESPASGPPTAWHRVRSLR